MADTFESGSGVWYLFKEYVHKPVVWKKILVPLQYLCHISNSKDFVHLGSVSLSKFHDPEGDFVGPQSLSKWHLHSQWMQTLQNAFKIILWE